MNFNFLGRFCLVFGLIFMGFWWGEYEEHDRNLEIDFWTSFWRMVFWFKFSNANLESLARFLNEPRLDLGSLGWLESIGMLEIVG